MVEKKNLLFKDPVISSNPRIPTHWDDLIKADTGPKEPGLQQPLKPIMVRGQKRGSKDPSPILLCDMFPSPARPKGRVSGLTLQTLNIFTKHKGHNCLPSTSFLPGTEIWILPQRSLPAEVSMIKQSFVVWLFSCCKSTFRCKLCRVRHILK